MLADESARQDEVAKALEDELASREAELQLALDDSHDKSGRLEAAAAEAADAAKTVAALQSAVGAAEEARDDVQGRLKVSEDALHLTRTERARLQAEVVTLGAIAA